MTTHLGKASGMKEIENQPTNPALKEGEYGRCCYYATEGPEDGPIKML